MWALSPGALPLLSSHWTGHVYADYSPSLTLRLFCLKKRERWVWKCFPISERLCSKAEKRSTTSLTWFLCWSLHQLPIPTKKRALRQGKDWAFTQSSSFYKISIRPELSWNVSWPRKHRSWLKDTMIDGSNWPGGMRDGEHRWSRRQMPPFKKSFPRWVWLTQLSCYLGVFPPQFPFATWVKSCATTMQQDEDIQATTTVPEPEGSPVLCPSTVQLVQLELHLFQYLPYQISPLLVLPQWGTPLLSSLPAPHRKSRTVLPAAYLIIATRWPMLTPKRLRLGTNTALHRVMRICPNWYWRLDPALNNEGSNLLAPFQSN